MRGTVSVPFTGFLVVDVTDVSNEDEAWDQAMDTIAEWGKERLKEEMYSNEFEFTREVTRGNATYAVLNEAEFDLEDDFTEDDGQPDSMKERQDFAQDELCLPPTRSTTYLVNGF
jgi:hypothetical protein